MVLGAYVTAGDLDALRAELLELRAEVARLRARVSDLEGQGFELVGPPTSAPAYETPPRGQAQVSASPSSARPSAAPTPSTLTRAEVCQRVGEFLRRALEGQHRGSSSRDCLALASRSWVVIRDYWGRVRSPPLVVSRFSDCKHLVKQGGDPGDSVFIGLPSRGDIKAALEAGGFELPPDL